METINKLLAAFPGSEFKQYGDAPGWIDTIVIYHAGCADGFGAAWAIHNKYKEKGFGYFYLPVGYGDREEVVETLARDFGGIAYHLLVVDFSLTAEQVAKLVPALHSLIIYDHHAGAESDLEQVKGLCYDEKVPGSIIFDNDRSGARITWDELSEEAPPEFLLAIEDRDLWRFKRPETKEICAEVYSHPMTLDAWDAIAATPFHDLAANGHAILRAHNKNVAALCRYFTLATFCGKKVAVVNAPLFVASDVCNKLLVDHPEIEIAAVCFASRDGDKWSFRARKGGVYLPDLLKPFGGGGHQAAAGVELNRQSPETLKFYGSLVYEN